MKTWQQFLESMATTHLFQALKENPTDPMQRKILADALEESGDTEDARVFRSDDPVFIVLHQETTRPGGARFPGQEFRIKTKFNGRLGWQPLFQYIRQNGLAGFTAEPDGSFKRERENNNGMNNDKTEIVKISTRQDVNQPNAIISLPPMVHEFLAYVLGTTKRIL